MKTRALVAGVFGAYYHVLIDGKRLKAKPRGRLRIEYGEKNEGYNKLRESLLAIGDFVSVTEDAKNRDTYAIDAVEPRRNAIHRASFGRQQCLAANVDGVIIMASFSEPDFNLGFVERAMVEVVLAGVELILIVNKIDLIGEHRDGTEENLAYYEKIGIAVFRESIRTQLSPVLSSKVNHGTWLLLGQSGTGKSTFLNKALGHDLQTVGEISLINKGRHTTTNPALYYSESKKDLVLIDVPGLREFGLHHRDAVEVKKGYSDFMNYACRFEDCLHLNEPGCGVKDAISSGAIAEFRYRCYVSMLDTVNENFKPRKGDYWRGVRK